MKTTFIISAVLIGATVLTFAANESSEVSTTYTDPGKFYGIIVNSNANIILSQGERNSIKMEGEKGELKEIHTHVDNGALIIDGGMAHTVTINITVEDISLVEINSSARLFSTGCINSDILLLKVNGNGSMKMDVRTLTLGMIVKGNGKITVSGSTGESYLRIHGDGTINTGQLDSFNSTEERTAHSDEKIINKRSALKLHQ